MGLAGMSSTCLSKKYSFYDLLPAHRQKVFDAFGGGNSSSRLELAYRKVISLPIHTELDETN